MVAQLKLTSLLPHAGQGKAEGRALSRNPLRLIRSSDHLPPLSYEDFCALAVTYMAPLYNAARRLTRDIQDAEDLVQDTYLRALRAYRQLERPSQCRAWLFQILHNVFVDAYRQKHVLRAHLVCDGDSATGDDLISTYLDSADGPEEQILRRLSQEEVRRTLATLPDDLRKVITLCDFDGLTYPEIAAVLGCPLGTVRSRLARARRTLLIKFRTQADSRGRGKGNAS